MTAIDPEPLAGIVESVLAHPGLRAKAEIGLVGEVLGGSDWIGGPGDDGAVVSVGPSRVVACGEAILPGFVAADPHGAGFAAVLTNVDDLAAMGAVPLAVVDTVVGPEPLARAVLAGMREAGELFDVPIVGGHLTIHDGPPAVSAFGLGEAPVPLSVTRAAVGQSLVVAAALDGAMRPDFPFFPAYAGRGRRCAGDVRLLAQLAADGRCVAAKDVSMAGTIGSLAMLLEPTGLGVTVDLDVLPRPAGVPMHRWLTCFPSYAFLLCVPAGREAECVAAFTGRELAAAVVGTLDDSGELALRSGSERRPVLDLASFRVTGLPR
jgi:selenophosphate synthetase-related protein